MLLALSHPPYYHAICSSYYANHLPENFENQEAETALVWFPGSLCEQCPLPFFKATHFALLSPTSPSHRPIKYLQLDPFAC